MLISVRAAVGIEMAPVCFLLAFLGSWACDLWDGKAGTGRQGEPREPDQRRKRKPTSWTSGTPRRAIGTSGRTRAPPRGPHQAFYGAARRSSQIPISGMQLVSRQVDQCGQVSVEKAAGNDRTPLRRSQRQAQARYVWAPTQNAPAARRRYPRRFAPQCIDPMTLGGPTHERVLPLGEGCCHAERPQMGATRVSGPCSTCLRRIADDRQPRWQRFVIGRALKSPAGADESAQFVGDHGDIGRPQLLQRAALIPRAAAKSRCSRAQSHRLRARRAHWNLRMLAMDSHRSCRRSKISLVMFSPVSASWTIIR